MNENDSRDTEAGRWVPDPDDPDFEVWEPMQANTTPEAAAKWDAMLEQNDGVRCVAHKKSGERCRRLAIKGATVCRVHGGASGHVKRAARARLENAADRMARELLKIAVSDDAPEGVKLAAIRDALDRAGLSAKTAVEVEIGAKGFEQVLEAMVIGGSRAESRSKRGEADDDGEFDWIKQELSHVIDAEVVDDPSPSSPPSPADPPPAQQPAPASELMSMEDALTKLRATPLPQPRHNPRS